jgi:hypothetical protein
LSAQAWEVRDLCVSIAVSLVAPNNCFSLFRVADECTLPQLQSVCLATGLTEFSQAVEIDKAGFCSLDLAQLLRFLENDRMQVILALCAIRRDFLLPWIVYDSQNQPSSMSTGQRRKVCGKGVHNHTSNSVDTSSYSFADTSPLPGFFTGN